MSSPIKSVTSKILLLSCGSFNPITIMHLRMFELARDYFCKQNLDVVGGIISPVSDAYGKVGLIPGPDRVAMARLAAQSNPWIRVSDWEVGRETIWTRTRAVLDYYSSQIDAVLGGQSPDIPDWFPQGSSSTAGPISLRLLCGADFLESFNVPNLWADEDMIKITRDYGLVVITRDGSDPQASINKSSILTKYQSNIVHVVEPIQNNISSTLMRRALSQGESIRYFVPDPHHPTQRSGQVPSDNHVCLLERPVFLHSIRF